MIKRITAILLTVLLTMSFLSCAAPKEGSDPAPTGAGSSETEAAGDTFIVRDRQCTFADMITCPVFESGDTIYFSTGSANNKKIYFTDKEYKEWMPLCFKPECSHRGLDCNAHLEGDDQRTIWPYGDHIYYVVQGTNTSPQLWRMKLDGSDHERLLLFNYTKEVNIYDEYTWDFSFHNKYVYAWLSASNEELLKTERGFETMIFVVDLSRDKLEAELTGLQWEVGLPVCGCGDTVYCINSVNNNSITKVDLAHGKAEKLCELPDYPDAGLVLKGDRIYSAFYKQDKLFAYIDVNTGELTEICPLERNMRYSFTDDYLIGSGSDTSKGEGTLIYDYEGNLIRHIPYETYNENVSANYCVGNYVFGYDFNDITYNGMVPPQWYLDLSELGSDDMTWHKWAPEE